MKMYLGRDLQGEKKKKKTESQKTKLSCANSENRYNHFGKLFDFI